MAKVKVAAEFLAERLFGCADFPVTISDIAFNKLLGVAVVEIEGALIPKCENISAFFTVRHNRAGETLHSVEFKPLTDGS